MKYFLILFLALAVWLGYEAHTYVPPVPTTKVVVAKISRLESLYQGYTQTCYYAIAADNTYCPVGIALYARLDSGHRVSSTDWRR